MLFIKIQKKKKSERRTKLSNVYGRYTKLTLSRFLIKKFVSATIEEESSHRRLLDLRANDASFLTEHAKLLRELHRSHRTYDLVRSWERKRRGKVLEKWKKKLERCGL